MDTYRVVAVLVAGVVVASSAAAAPEDREARIRAELRRLLSPFGVTVEAEPVSTGRWRQVRIAWNRAGAALAGEERPFARSATVVGERMLDAPPARQRSLDLSAEQILIAGVDARRRLRWWSVTADPRRLRAETTDADGHWVRHESPALVAGSGYRALASLTVEIPDDKGIAQVHVYEPRWTGSRFDLRAVATVDVGRGR